MNTIIEFGNDENIEFEKDENIKVEKGENIKVEKDEKLQFEQLNKSDIEISPNGKYIAAYSKQKGAIAWWIKDSKDETYSCVKICHVDGKILNICVSDQKKIAYIYCDGHHPDYHHISKYCDLIYYRIQMICSGNPIILLLL